MNRLLAEEQRKVIPLRGFLLAPVAGPKRWDRKNVSSGNQSSLGWETPREHLVSRSGAGPWMLLESLTL